MIHEHSMPRSQGYGFFSLPRHGNMAVPPLWQHAGVVLRGLAAGCWQAGQRCGAHQILAFTSPVIPRGAWGRLDLWRGRQVLGSHPRVLIDDHWTRLESPSPASAAGRDGPCSAPAALARRLPLSTTAEATGRIAIEHPKAAPRSSKRARHPRRSHPTAPTANA